MQALWLKQGNDHVGKTLGPQNSHKLDREKLVKLVTSKPDMMLKEYAQILGVPINTVWYSLKVLGYTRKKWLATKRKKHYEN